MSLAKKWLKPYEVAKYSKTEPKLQLSMPKNPYNSLPLGHIDEFDFSILTLVLILSCLPLLREGTTTDFPEPGSSHDPGVVLSGFEYIISTWIAFTAFSIETRLRNLLASFYAHAGFHIKLGGDQFCRHMFKGLDYLLVFADWLSCTFSLTPPLQQQGLVSTR